MLRLTLIVLITSLTKFEVLADSRPPCFSNIYCHGKLLHTVQMNKIYEDSKTFVDMKMRENATTTLRRFEDFMSAHNNQPEREDVIKFVDMAFEPAGSEFEDWVPNDWNPSPSYIKNIKDEEYKIFANDLNEIWKDLGRKMKDEIKDEEHLYSIIWVPNPVIVPGGRFREFYYWDSYWIVQGLLHSEMYETVRGMLSNFAFIVDKYDHIPNGGRIYYLERSQPPLFIPMAKLYQDKTNDIEFIKSHIDSFDREFEYWMKNHLRVVEKDGKNYSLLTYGDKSQGPRPESYSEDVDSARYFKDDAQKEEYYSELKAAAESGWDFSSRWFIVNGTNKGNLTNIKTRSILPVDLNAMFYWNAVILSEWHSSFGNTQKSYYYKDIADRWLQAVEAILWHEVDGIWLDYDLENNIPREHFYPSNLSPLWTGCYNKSNTDRIVRLVLKYLDNKNVVASGGVPTSREHTGEQWDYPNAWPPLQHMIIVGLSNTGNKAASRLAYELADRWVRSNYKAYAETEAMFEKYDATVLGGHGGGGEYEVQLGFGWSNGVIMDLLYRYGNELSYSELYTLEDISEVAEPMEGAATGAKTIGQIMTGFVALAVTIAAGYIG
ncbi:PREDICTED: trehalase isoform X2 [Nicrophorus vespilloides]|nr:PREDICTED: trehalase isoform X2 [Nicrophorus vespilloides]